MVGDQHDKTRSFDPGVRVTIWRHCRRCKYYIRTRTVSDPLMSQIHAILFKADATMRRLRVLFNTASTSSGARLAMHWPSSHGSDQKKVLAPSLTTQLIEDLKKDSVTGSVWHGSPAQGRAESVLCSHNRPVLSARPNRVMSTTPRRRGR
jgi:hypothetical protein